MKISYKGFGLDLSWEDVSSVLRRFGEVLNMQVPLWLLVLIFVLLYLAVWRYFIWRWQTQSTIEVLCSYLSDIRKRFFDTQEIEEKTKQSLISLTLPSEILPWFKEWDNKPSAGRPKLLKFWRWPLDY